MKQKKDALIIDPRHNIFPPINLAEQSFPVIFREHIVIPSICVHMAARDGEVDKFVYFRWQSEKENIRWYNLKSTYLEWQKCNNYPIISPITTDF